MEVAGECRDSLAVKFAACEGEWRGKRGKERRHTAAHRDIRGGGITHKKHNIYIYRYMRCQRRGAINEERKRV